MEPAIGCVAADGGLQGRAGGRRRNVTIVADSGNVDGSPAIDDRKVKKKKKKKKKKK